MESASTSSSGAFELCQWAIENRDDELFAAALPAVATADKGATIDLAEDAFRAGMYAAVAEAIPVLAAIGRLAPALAKRRQALLDELRDKASILFTDGDGRTAYRCAKALADLEAVPPGQLRTDRIALDAKRLIRSWVVDARTTIREAADKSGPEEVARIADNYGDLSAADTATAIAVARAFHALGRTEYALSILKRVDGEQAQGHTYRRWTGRMAANAFDYGTALDMYGALQDDPTVPPKLRAEVDRFFASARSRAVRQLRSLVMADRFNEALALATSIMKRTGEVERVERELARMFRRLRGILLEIEQGEGDSTDRERILQLIVRIRPNDQSMLRRLALELMRQFRFAEAAEIWSRIRVIAPENESAIRNLDRCEILARRRSGAPIAA
jgi:tetratricopeptide (TPR) repeat protein